MILKTNNNIRWVEYHTQDSNVEYIDTLGCFKKGSILRAYSLDNMLNLKNYLHTDIIPHCEFSDNVLVSVNVPDNENITKKF